MTRGTRRRPLRPCEAFAALAALLRAPHDAERLADADLIAAFPAGTPQHVAALLAGYPELVALDGWAALFHMPAPQFRRLVDAARSDAMPAAIRDPLSERVGLHLVRDLAEQLARVPHAVVFDGRRILAALHARAERPRRAQLRAVDYVLAQPTAAAAVSPRSVVA